MKNPLFYSSLSDIISINGSEWVIIPKVLTRVKILMNQLFFHAFCSYSSSLCRPPGSRKPIPSSSWTAANSQKVSAWSEKQNKELQSREDGWDGKRIGEAAKTHYLSVLYLFHMLLLSNLSPQIPDSENKQRDQSGPSPRLRRRVAAASPRGWVQDGGTGRKRLGGSYR